MKTNKSAAAAKDALTTIFSARNTVVAGLVASAAIFGHYKGYELYEKDLEELGIDTLPDRYNFFYPVTEDGKVDWDEINHETTKLIRYVIPSFE